MNTPGKNISEDYPFILLEWEDSRILDDWREPAEVGLEVPTIRSVGWVLNEDDKSLAIAGTYAPMNGQFCAILVIPKGCVRKRMGIVWPNETKTTDFPADADNWSCDRCEKWFSSDVSKEGNDCDLCVQCANECRALEKKL